MFIDSKSVCMGWTIFGLGVLLVTMVMRSVAAEQEMAAGAAVGRRTCAL